MRVAFDSMVLTYFLDACHDGYCPSLDPDPVRDQRVAAFRLFMFTENPAIVPTLFPELQKIKDAAKHDEHFRFAAYSLFEVPPGWLVEEQVVARAAELAAHHSGANDCRIVAECEQVRKIDMLATFDGDLIKHLRAKSAKFIGTPEECWRRANVLHGATANVKLLPGHPHYAATWWHW